MNSPPFPPCVCPRCRGPLAFVAAGAECPACPRRFEAVAGILDLRLRPNERDLQLARRLVARSEQVDLATLLDEGQVGRVAALRERFARRQVTLPETFDAYLDALERGRGAPLGTGDRVLEVGCGSGAFALVMARRGARVTATDVSMRALVLARARLRAAGEDRVRLVCCTVEALPLTPASMDVVVAADVIEHVADPTRLLAAGHAVLAPEGLLFLATPNRFSLSLEPHVRLWGVGLLPRRLGCRYVRLARGVPYEDIHPLSARALGRLLRAHGFAARIVPPEIPAATARLYGGFERRLIRAYNLVARSPLARPFLLAVGPFFHVFARRGLESGRASAGDGT